MLNLFDILLQVSSLEYVSSSKSASGWDARGSGHVVVDRISEKLLTFKESGVSQLKNGRELKFSNTYRWTKLADDRLCLEHLRRGLDNPLLLFEIKQMSEIIWKSESAHLCGTDLYTATLEILEAGNLKIDWQVRGDRKDESVSYLYKSIASAER